MKKKIKQAKQDWPNLPVLGSHSTKSSSSLEHSADDTRSSDVGCACKKKQGVGEERGERDKETNEQKHRQLSMLSCLHHYYRFPFLRGHTVGCRIFNFPIAVNGSGSGQYVWVLCKAEWPKVVLGDSSRSHKITDWLYSDFSFNFENQRGGKQALAKGGQYKNTSQLRNALQLWEGFKCIWCVVSSVWFGGCESTGRYN